MAKGGTRVAVWCKRDYGEQRLLGWMPMTRKVTYEHAPFHGLQSGFGIPSDHAEAIDLGGGVSRIEHPPKFRGELYMAFRMSDVAFELFTQHSVEADAKGLLLRVAEAIYRENESRLAQPGVAVDPRLRPGN